MRRIVVQWGDGTINTLRHRPGIEAAIGQQSQLPPGTYKLSHAYAAPEDRKAFKQVVLIRVEDRSGGVDFCIHNITLTPRYRVTNYRTTLTLASNCDWWFENKSEFDITQYVDGAIANYWRWEPSESIVPVSLVLEGSLVSRELTVADGLLRVELDIVERDFLFHDDLTPTSMSLSAMDESRSISVTIEAYGCKLNYRYDKEVTLMVPLPPYGQTVVATANP